MPPFVFLSSVLLRVHK